MSNEISVLSDEKVISLFTKEGGIKDNLDSMANEIRAEVSDITTTKGRKDIATRAHRVAKMKVRLDGLGKGLVSEWKEQAKKVDAERKYSRDFLDDLKAEIRLPLSEWEAKEKKRIEEERLSASIAIAWNDAHSEDVLFNREQAIRAKEEQAAIEAQEKAAMELAKEAAKQQKMREEEAAARAINDAEEAAAMAQARESEAKAQAELAKERALREAIEAEERRKADIAKAEQRVIQERNDAIDREKAAQAKREANKAHIGKINRAALNSLVKAGLDPKSAKIAIISISKKEIPNVVINY